ncbi:CDP-glycerol glycerophosphotransferase family protein [Thermococcus argininiproducens]|uniref:CDP-glycerol glycerophosphotransferase family protein n=1 Tax=Thermococcus argininiproducens TaxID=2866384 RepID=A0A9E7SCE5_9EURY|nr:CDP-glycerol glycerophosphotransferase family protein [Thermococcus argininiproducens]USG99097.1 CDP-glycerol glycerophosphotransferase family protein [Thermococcus argininiproducens]
MKWGIFHRVIGLFPQRFKFFVVFVGSHLLAVISILIPKDSKRIMLISYPSFAGNMRYIYERMKELEQFRDYKFIWPVENKGVFGKRENTKFVMYGTVEYLWQLLRSKYIFSSQRIPYWKAKNQIGVMIWHAVPGKRGFWFDKRYQSWVGRLILKSTLRKIDYVVATSEFTKVLFSAIFHIHPEKILVLGMPRCDALFKEKGEALKRLESLLGSKIKNRRIVFYLPTFRDYDRRVTQELFTNLVKDQKFREYLEQRKALFIFKPHPHDEVFVKKYSDEYIRVITNHELMEAGLTLYDILPAADILVTDYSSVFRDYLLLNRPVIFYIPDKKKYCETRGLVLEPFELWTPGDKAKTVEELLKALDEAFENPKKWEKERLWLRDLFFKYKDDRSSDRVIEYFWPLSSVKK